MIHEYENAGNLNYEMDQRKMHLPFIKGFWKTIMKRVLKSSDFVLFQLIDISDGYNYPL